MSGKNTEAHEATLSDVLTPGVVLAVKLPVPLSRMGRYLRGWSKRAHTEQRGGYLVVIEPEDGE